jgi:hypothetical protein
MGEIEQASRLFAEAMAAGFSPGGAVQTKGDDVRMP